MPIHVTDKPDVYVTVAELSRYRDAYQKAFAFYAGTPPTLEEFILRQRVRERTPLKDRIRSCP